MGTKINDVHGRPCRLDGLMVDWADLSESQFRCAAAWVSSWKREALLACGETLKARVAVLGNWTAPKDEAWMQARTKLRLLMTAQQMRRQRDATFEPNVGLTETLI